MPPEKEVTTIKVEEDQNKKIEALTIMHFQNAVNEGIRFIPSESVLNRQKIANELEIGELIGVGKFGRVHRCTYRGERVAVKKFYAHAQSSWSWECSMYQTIPLGHPNILRYIAGDQSSKCTFSVIS